MLESMCVIKVFAILDAINSLSEDNLSNYEYVNCLDYLVASSNTIFGCDIEETQWRDKSNFERLFEYLTKLDIPPARVDFTEDTVHLAWWSVGSPYLRKNEYFDLLFQFQKFIDTIKELDLHIDYDRTKVDIGADVYYPNMSFTKEYFNNGETTPVIEFYNCGMVEQSFAEHFKMSYDIEGNVICDILGQKNS